MHLRSHALGRPEGRTANSVLATSRLIRAAVLLFVALNSAIVLATATAEELSEVPMGTALPFTAEELKEHTFDLAETYFEQFQHPNGQIPAYEWEFSDMNPPVHAWAVWRVYKIADPKGQRDIDFLERAFQKLLLARGVDLVSYTGGVTSAAHTETDIQNTLEIFQDVIRSMVKDKIIGTLK